MGSNDIIDAFKNAIGSAPEKPPKYIGVPDNYMAPNMFRPTPGSSASFRAGESDPARGAAFVAPKFLVGAEYGIAGLGVENLARLQSAMVTAGLIGPKTKIHVGFADDTTIGAYKTLLGFANRYGVDASTALNMLASNPEFSASGGSGGGGGGTSTSTHVSLTDPTTAKQVLTKVLQQELGRAPTAQETSQFVSTLNASEKANPTVTTTTYDGAGNSSSTTRQSNVDPTAMALDTAQTGELGRERGMFKTSTDYYAAALSSIGAGGLSMGRV